MLNFEIRKKYFAILAKKISDVYEIITGIPPLSLPNSKGKNLKSYSISGNVDEDIIGYSDNTPLPNGYVLLDYIGTTGTQYLTISNDMQYDTSDIDISIVCTVSAILSTQQTIIGSYDNQWNLWTINNQMGFFTNGKTTDRYTGIASNTKISVRIYQNQTVKKLFVDGNEITTNDTPVINALGLQLFTYSDGTAKLSGRIYSVSGHISNTQINLVPCINPNGEIGMYDTVGNKFHGNAGTGTFTKSPFNLLRTAGRTEQTTGQSGSAASEKRLLQCDKYVKGIAINNSLIAYAITNVQIGANSISCSISAVGGTVALPVKLKNNVSYSINATISSGGQIRLISYQKDGTFNGEISASASGTVKRFTVPNNADIVCILLRRAGSTDESPYTFSNIMLVEGAYISSNMPAYTQYKQLLTEYSGVGDYDNTTNKYKIPVLSAGKNKIGILGRSFQEMTGGTTTKRIFAENSYCYLVYNNNSSSSAISDVIFENDNTAKVSFKIAKAWNGLGFPVNLEAGKRYTFAAQITENNEEVASYVACVMHYAADGTYLGRVESNYIRRDGLVIKAFDTPQDCVTTVFLITRDTGTITTPLSLTVSDVRLFVGDYTSQTIPAYEPYIQPTSNNIFINNSLFKTGENVDTVNYPKNKITKAVGKYVFTGTESIELYDNSKGFRFAVSDMETGNCIDGYCNRFENFKNVTDNDVPRVFFGYNNNYVYFKRFSETATTAEAIKATLADWYSSGKPLTIWYPLENETEETISLPDIPTVQGNTTIMIDTEVQPSEVTVEYATEEA